MNDRTTYSVWMMCFLAGGLVGASAALLLAPQSGKASRESMRRTLRETTDSARGLKDRLVRRAEESRDEGAASV